MEKIYCDYWKDSADRSYPYESCRCEFPCGCVYDGIIDILKAEGLFCPFWDVKVKWMDAQLLCELLDAYI
jgi:hypothetical protein